MLLKHCKQGFNVKLLSGVEEEAARYDVKIFQDQPIYLVDNYIKWRDELKKLREKRRIEALINPAKIKLLRKSIFRRSKPAIGVRVLAGELRKECKPHQVRRHTSWKR